MLNPPDAPLIELTDAQWAKILPLLPQARTGRPSQKLRAIINGLVWFAAHPDATWRDVPPRYGPWSTIANQYYRWRKAGVWDPIEAAIWQVLQESPAPGP